MGTKRTQAIRTLNPVSVSIDATIPSGQPVSEWIDLGQFRICGMVMPAAWDAAVVTFDVSVDFGVTACPLFDENNAELTITVAAGRAHKLPPAAFLGWTRVRLRSGTSASPVNQTANRVVNLVAEP